MKNCPVCENENINFIRNNLRFNLVGDLYGCSNCDLEFLDQKSFSLPESFYESDYHQTYLTHVEPDAFEPQKYFDKMTKVIAPWVNRLLPYLNENVEVLDVGCSTGHLIKAIETKCHKVYGHELNIKEVEFCKNELKLDVDNISLIDRFGDKKFDLITLYFVLEHIGEPELFLRELKSFLKPSGKIVILVPHVKDPLVKLYDIPEFKDFYYCQEHLFYHSKKSLELVAKKIEMQCEIEICQEYPLSNHMNWFFNRRPLGVVEARAQIGQGSGDVGSVWQDLESEYKQSVVSKGYGDRLWCVLTK